MKKLIGVFLILGFCSGAFAGTKSSNEKLSLGAGEVVVSQVDKPVFTVKTEDETLYLALRRWISGTQYQLIWSAGKDFPAQNTVYQAATLEDAVEAVMSDTQRSSFPLHACLYENNVIRVLHVSKSCERYDDSKDKE